MDIRFLGFDSPIVHTLQNMLVQDDSDNKSSIGAPTRTYVRDASAMAATPADVKEYPNSYLFVIDMPGLKSRDIRVQIEDDRVLLISGVITLGSIIYFIYENKNKRKLVASMKRKVQAFTMLEVPIYRQNCETLINEKTKISLT
ncbi:hypothetical protein OROGR_012789 [Orobanche gracilis]